MIGDKTIIKKFINNNNGVTLVELLVASVLFLIVVIFGTSIYVSISRVQKANSGAQKVYTESRFLMDMIANDVQSNVIDLSVNYPSSIPETTLRLKAQDGSIIEYWADGGQLKRRIGGGVENVISSIAIEITKLNFYIKNLGVPSVTIVWQAKEMGVKDSAILNLQTTISSRNY